MTLPPEIAWLLDSGAHHLRGEDVTDYVDDILSPSERVRVESHIADCAQCRLIVAEVRDAVATDLANPGRLDAAVARIAGAGPATDMPPLAEAIPPPSGFANRARGFGRVALERVEATLSSLANWTPQAAVASAPLAEGRPTYAGAQSDLEALFPPDILRADLDWAMGPLVVGAAYEATGTLRSIRASVGVRHGEAGKPITLELFDRAGGRTVLTLSPDRPSDARNAPTINGAIEDLEFRLSVGRDVP